MDLMLYKIGITGNICSGKSAAVKFLSKQPYSFGLNFDEIGHIVYLRNPIFFNLVKTIFYPLNYKIVQNENTFFEKFVRKELGNVVFKEMSKLQVLNCLIRPQMRYLLELHIKGIEDKLKRENKNGILFVEGAIIIEGKANHLFDEIWLTLADNEEIQTRFIKRLQDNKVSEYDKMTLDKILRTQMSNNNKKKYCSEVIDTTGQVEETQIKYTKLYEKIAKRLNL